MLGRAVRSPMGRSSPIDLSGCHRDQVPTAPTARRRQRASRPVAYRTAVAPSALAAIGDAPSSCGTVGSPPRGWRRPHGQVEITYSQALHRAEREPASGSFACGRARGGRSAGAARADHLDGLGDSVGPGRLLIRLSDPAQRTNSLRVCRQISPGRPRSRGRPRCPRGQPGSTTSARTDR